MQNEMKEVIRLMSERESMIINENNALKASNKKLLGFGETREKILQDELLEIKKELKSIQVAYNKSEVGNMESRALFQKELEEY
mmetsp:Transcript_41786/g.40137  ORF Transcript_41786/g.40137 Transcript_41786/m.40137 type:complete len:84 (+) Transcript_41786:1177-1428(+)